MKKKLKELVDISRFYGRNPAYVIAGGGNTSFKTEDKIWVKASGISMADIEEDGFVCLSREKLKKISTNIYGLNSTKREAEVKKDLYAAILYPENKRPSVETSLHEMIRFPFVVHTHPTLVNALMCSKKSKEITNELFGEKVLYIEYTDPGYILFKKIEEEIIRYIRKFKNEPSIIFLQNHGVFVAGNTVEEIRQRYREIELQLMGKIQMALPDDTLIKNEHTELISVLAKNFSEINTEGCLVGKSKLIDSFVKNEDVFEKVNRPFTPDDIVYCKSNYVFTSSNAEKLVESIKVFKKEFRYMPKVVAIEGHGILAFGENKKSAETILQVFLNMMKVSFYSENFGGPNFMKPEQIKFIDNWEVENYRRKVATKTL